MMLTSTIPDKLAVTSFVYQMYMYFTRATLSAIAKYESGQGNNESQNKPSPFDMTSFDQFTFDKLSPVASPQTKGDRLVNVYSRFHPRRDSSSSEVVASEVPLSPVQESSGTGGSENGSSATVDSEGKGSGSHVGSADPVALGSIPKPSKEDGRPTQEGHRSEDGTAGESRLLAGDTVTPSRVDTVEGPARVKGSQSSNTSLEQLSNSTANGHTQLAASPPMPSKEGDRTLELENLCDSDSEPTTVRSCSLDSSSDLSLLEGRKGEQGGCGVQEERKRSSQPTAEKNVGSLEQVSPEHDAEVCDVSIRAHVYVHV